MVQASKDRHIADETHQWYIFITMAKEGFAQMLNSIHGQAHNDVFAGIGVLLLDQLEIQDFIPEASIVIPTIGEFEEEVGSISASCRLKNLPVLWQSIQERACWIDIRCDLERSNGTWHPKKVILRHCELGLHIYHFSQHKKLYLITEGDHSHHISPAYVGQS